MISTFFARVIVERSNHIEIYSSISFYLRTTTIAISTASNDIDLRYFTISFMKQTTSKV